MVKDNIVFKVGNYLNGSQLTCSFNDHNLNMLVYGTSGCGISNEMNFIFRNLVKGDKSSANYTLNIIDCSKYIESSTYCRDIKPTEHFSKEDNLLIRQEVIEFLCTLTSFYNLAHYRYNVLKESMCKTSKEYNLKNSGGMVDKVIIFTGLNNFFNSRIDSAFKDEVLTTLMHLAKFQRSVGIYCIFDISGIASKYISIFNEFSDINLVLRCDTEKTKILTDSIPEQPIVEKYGYGYYYNKEEHHVVKFRTGVVLEGE